jgi:hypothetical protein
VASRAARRTGRRAVNDGALPSAVHPGREGLREESGALQALGFEERWSSDAVVGFALGPAAFILQDVNLPEVAAQMMVRIDVDDLDAWWRANEAALAEVKSKPPTQFAWGREVHFIDFAGVCWHVGA